MFRNVLWWNFSFPLNLREGRRGRSREKLWGRKRRRRRREWRVMADAPACTPPPIPPPPPRLEASSNGPAEIFPPPRFFACIILHFPKCFLFYCNMEKNARYIPPPPFSLQFAITGERERESNDFRRGSKLLPSVDGKNKPKLFLPPFPK